jgi:hypothetical protein
MEIHLVGIYDALSGPPVVRALGQPEQELQHIGVSDSKQGGTQCHGPVLSAPHESV